jgi:hypothetical protein
VGQSTAALADVDALSWARSFRRSSAPGTARACASQSGLGDHLCFEVFELVAGNQVLRQQSRELGQLVWDRPGSHVDGVVRISEPRGISRLRGACAAP